MNETWYVLVQRPKKGKMLFGTFPSEEYAKGWIVQAQEKHSKWKCKAYAMRDCLDLFTDGCQDGPINWATVPAATIAETNVGGEVGRMMGALRMISDPDEVTDINTARLVAEKALHPERFQDELDEDSEADLSYRENHNLVG